MNLDPQEQERIGYITGDKALQTEGELGLAREQLAANDEFIEDALGLATDYAGAVVALHTATDRLGVARRDLRQAAHDRLKDLENFLRKRNEC